jgi:hypothetical protein
MKKLFLAGLVFTLALTSCKNNDDDCTLTRDSIVGTYKITAARYQPNGGGSDIDLFALSAPCERDDLVIFNDNGVVNYQDVGTVCSPSGNDTGTWTLSGNTLTLDQEPSTVSSFECTTMVLKQTDGTGGVSTVTFQRQ